LKLLGGRPFEVSVFVLVDFCLLSLAGGLLHSFRVATDCKVQFCFTFKNTFDILCLGSWSL
jgi:hypothetical protein